MNNLIKGITNNKAILSLKTRIVLVYLAVLVLYLIFTILLTYPLINNMSNTLMPGDPSLVTWILAWDTHSILTNPLNLFNANIFYPCNANSLAFSEHLIADTIFTLPIMLITNNPVLSYNLVFILSFMLSAFGMFILADYYLKDKYSAFLAGVVFSFCTYRFAHLGHLHLLTTQWMPLSVLLLDLFLHKKENKFLILFSLFYLLQILSGWYNAFYTTILLVLYFVFIIATDEIIRKNIFSNWNLQFKMLVSLIVIIIITLPFAIPYITANKEYGFSRSLDEVQIYSADVADYFHMPFGNVIYGNILHISMPVLNSAEHSLFPGMTVIVLSSIGLISFSYIKRTKKYKLGLGLQKIQIFYILLAIIAFIFSLGYPIHIFNYVIDIITPYYVLYKFIPGLASMRCPSRIDILVTFSLSILAAYGLNKIIRSKGNFFRASISALFVGAILLESLYVPIGYGIAPTGKDIPDVYKWLGDQSGNINIVELPTSNSISPYYDSQYMYYSTYHWKMLMNGFSGFYPQIYFQIIDILREFPSNESIDVLKNYNVTYVIVHSKNMDNSKWEMIKNNITQYDSVKLVKIFGDDYVYQVNLSDVKRLTFNSLSVDVNIPTNVSGNKTYACRININNPNDINYFSSPWEKFTVTVSISRNGSSTFKQLYQTTLMMPLMIRSKSEIVLDFNVNYPAQKGKYIIYTKISDTVYSDDKNIEKEVYIID